MNPLYPNEAEAIRAKVRERIDIGEIECPNDANALFRVSRRSWRLRKGKEKLILREIENGSKRDKSRQDVYTNDGPIPRTK